MYKDKYTMTNALKANIEKFIHNISANMLGKVCKNLKFTAFPGNFYEISQDL